MEKKDFLKRLADCGIDREFVVSRCKKKLLLKCEQWPIPFKVEEKPHVRTRLRLYCENCKRYHHLWWGEVKNSLKTDPSSIQDLINHYEDKYCNPQNPKLENELERKLSILRAQKLVNPNTIIPQHLIDMVKYQKPDRVKQLWNEVENLGAEVRELIYERNGIYSFKIITPITGYLSCGTKEEIIDLVRNDCDLYRNTNCPFCKKNVSLDRDHLGLGECNNCLAIFGSIATPFSKESLALLSKIAGINGVYTLLLNWENRFYRCYKTDFVWIDIQWILNNLNNFDLSNSYSSSKLQELDVPLFEDEDALDEDEKIRPAKCSECIHRLEIYCHGYHCGVEPVCVYPHHYENYQEKIGFELEFKIERLGDYQECPEGIVWNKFLSHFIESQFTYLSHANLRGYSIDTDKFIKDICPNFELDKNCCDLKENSGFLITKGVTKISFENSLKKIC